MKTKICIAGLLLAFGLAIRAFALAGDLREPGLAFPAEFPESARTNISAALRRADCKFLGGNFINSFTSLRYGGDARALNLFLEGLAKCPGVVLSVSFHKEQFAPDCDWLVTHMAGKPYRLEVRINLKSSRMKPELLTIPEIKGPPLEEK